MFQCVWLLVENVFRLGVDSMLLVLVTDAVGIPLCHQTFINSSALHVSLMALRLGLKYLSALFLKVSPD